MFDAEITGKYYYYAIYVRLLVMYSFALIRFASGKYTANKGSYRMMIQ